MEYLPYQNPMQTFAYISNDYAPYAFGPPPPIPNQQHSGPITHFLTHRASVPNMPRGRLQTMGKTESKPRLTKEERDVLEREFQKTYKPSSATKKELAEMLKLDRVKVDTWFQNRRAKAKQEKKQEQKAEEARLAKLKKDQDGSDDEAVDASSSSSSAQPQETEEPQQEQQASPESSAESSERAHPGAPPSIASFSTDEDQSAQNAPFMSQFEDSSVEPMGSLDGVVMASLRQAKSAEELSTMHHQASGMHPGYDVSSPFGCFARTSIPRDSLAGSFDMSSVPSFQTEVYDERHYSVSAADSASIPGDMPQLPYNFSESSLSSMFMSGTTSPYGEMNFDQLPEVFDDTTSTPTCNFPGSSIMVGPVGETFDASAFPSTSPGQNEAVDAFFGLKPPPPPSDLASRRAGPRPAALATNALSSHGSTAGPRTYAGTESKRAVGPLSPAHRISHNNLNRIHKASSNTSQRPQRNLSNFSDASVFLGQANHNLKMPMSAGLPGRSASLAPPTPLSPRMLQQPRERSLSATPSNSDIRTTVIFEETNQSLVSPPETPHQFQELQQQAFAQNEGLLHAYGWEMDQPLHTPAADSFAFPMQMPEPQYIAPPSSGSEPATPGFGQAGQHSFTLGPQSPPLGAAGLLADSMHFPADYTSFYAMSSDKPSPTQGKQTVYTFNVTTPAAYKAPK